jgi:hypothetical protein
LKTLYPVFRSSKAKTKAITICIIRNNTVMAETYISTV